MKLPHLGHQIGYLWRAYPSYRMLWHFLYSGAVFGLNTKLDPDETEINLKGRPPLMIPVFIVAGVIILWGPLPLALALVLMFCSPLLGYTVVNISDYVMEMRGYFASAGAALAVAWLPWRLACVVVVLWMALSVFRAFAYRNETVFWSQAVKESPNKVRVLLNYASRLRKGIDDREMESVMVKALSLTKKIHPDWPKIISNLTRLYLMQGKTGSAKKTIAIGFDAWPDEPHLHTSRGLYLMTIYEFSEAIMAFDNALNKGGSEIAELNRSICLFEIGAHDSCYAGLCRGAETKSWEWLETQLSHWQLMTTLYDEGYFGKEKQYAVAE